MTYEEYVAATQKGSALLDAGDRDGAIAAFVALVNGDLLRADLGLKDRTRVSENIKTLSV